MTDEDEVPLGYPGDGPDPLAEYDDEGEPTFEESALAAARAVVELLADPMLADPGQRYRDAIEALRDALDEVDEAERR